jgi:2-haloalkanoic acid dehalogenase type II
MKFLLPFLSVFSLLGVVASKASTGAVTVPSCSDFNPKTVKLITFDVFAALMDLETSLIASATKILPKIGSYTIKTLVQTWEGAYGDYAGTVFNETITGPEPFQWMLTTTLTTTLSHMCLSVTDVQFNALVKAWGDLTPWVNTKESLTKLYNAGYEIGALSNGDHNVLNTALQVFLPEVKFTHIFSSDFPVGSFKPDIAMYNQIESTTNFTASQHLHVAGAQIDGWGARQAGRFSALLDLTAYPEEPYPCFLLADITGVPPIFGL